MYIHFIHYGSGVVWWCIDCGVWRWYMVVMHGGGVLMVVVYGGGVLMVVYGGVLWWYSLRW